MQRISTLPPAGAPRSAGDRRPRLLVVELWGLGDLALALPFLRTASRHARVTLLAKPHAAPLLRRFCPEVEHVALTAPWTAFTGKYRLLHWPWAELRAVLRALCARRFDAAVSVRADPRDHALMAFAGAKLRAGFPRAGSSVLLTDRLTLPANPHRAAQWSALAANFGWSVSAIENPQAKIQNHVVVHTGAGHAVREWPRDRYEDIAARLRAAGWRVTLLDDSLRDLDTLLATLATADRFIGNDSGPGHLAALLGVPTFTIFGPQLPEVFSPVHPQAAWIEGRPCVYKPCRDSCRFSSPHCIRELTADGVWSRLSMWLPTRPA